MRYLRQYVQATVRLFCHIVVFFGYCKVCPLSINKVGRKEIDLSLTPVACESRKHDHDNCKSHNQPVIED